MWPQFGHQYEKKKGPNRIITLVWSVINYLKVKNLFEQPHEKTNNLHICENKDADQIRGNREADQRLCFHYTDSTVPFLLKSEISSF